MKVKIGTDEFNSVKTPIALVLNSSAKTFIENTSHKTLTFNHKDISIKVKIGDKTYNSSAEIPVKLFLNDDEKKLLSNMGDQNNFCSFNENCDIEEIRKFMKDDSEKIPVE